MFSEIKSAGLFGLNAFMVTVQASIAPGQPSFDIVGMPDIAVQESKARIRAVLGHLELKLLNGKVTVNLPGKRAQDRLHVRPADNNRADEAGRTHHRRPVRQRFHRGAVP